jgi:hypothetical protein
VKKHVHTKSRATNVEELGIILGKYFSRESLEHGLAFQPKSSDIIISPYAKCGTTWLQQIAHGLRTRGSMDFEEINDVTPWIEIAADVGWDLDAAQVADPRVFKSHRSWHDIPKGGRYIVSFRHYQEALVSFYRFFEGYYFEAETISLEALTRWRWPEGNLEHEGYWYYLISWWEQRDNKDVLLLCYEDMKADLPGTVKLIAHFMGIELDEELLAIVVHQSSRDFMLAHKDQFDEKHMARIGGERAGLPPVEDSYKITPGASNDPRYQLSPALKKELDDMWREQMEPKYGFRNYGELRQAIKELQESYNPLG